MATSKSQALTKKEKPIVDIVEKRIQTLMQSQRLVVPEGYEVGTALRAAYLMLQDVEDKNGRPALSVCTRESIADALLKMVVLGLYPDRTQGYFIVYGNKLVFMPSYFGKILVAKRDAMVREVYPRLVFEGDEFFYEINNGMVTRVTHKQKLENVDESKIVAAYCVVTYNDGRPDKVEIMTWKQIQNSWAKSKTKKVQQSDPGEMAKRTVIARALKLDINTSISSFPELSEQDFLENKIELGEEDSDDMLSSGGEYSLPEPATAPIKDAPPTNAGEKEPATNSGDKAEKSQAEPPKEDLFSGDSPGSGNPPSLHYPDL